MRTSELYRCIADATGESLDTIRQLGFSLIEEPEIELDDEDGIGPNVVDWDQLEFQRDEQLYGSDWHATKAV